MKELLTQPIKWHGGKHYLAPKIIALFPPRCKTPNAPSSADAGWLHYVEPYFGGGSVLLANDPVGISEVVSDLNGEVSNFWRVLADADKFYTFERIVQATPFSEFEWTQAGDDVTTESPTAVERAVRFFIRCRQSLAGRMRNFSPLTRRRTRRGMNEQASAWLNAVDGLAAVHARMKRVVVLNSPAPEVIRKQDGPRTLFYLDPPYVHSSRATTSEYGDFEMQYTDHDELLTVLGDIKGRFLLSGYCSTLYDYHACQHGWNRHDFEIDNKAAKGENKRKMTECVWTNF